MILPRDSNQVIPEVTPEENEEDMRTVAQEYAEKYEAALRQVMTEGLAFFHIQKPADRYRAYVQRTLMTIEIANARHEAQVAALQGAISAQEAQKALDGLLETEVAQRLELQMILSYPDWPDRVRQGTLPFPRSEMWSLLFTLPPFVVDHFHKDFLEVAKQQQAREQRDMEA